MSGDVAIAQDGGLPLQLVQPVLDHVTDANQALELTALTGKQRTPLVSGRL